MPWISRDARTIGPRSSIALVLACFGALVALLTAAGAAAPEVTAFGRLEPGSQWFAMGADYKRSSRFTLSEAGTVTDLVAYLDGAGGSSGSQEIRFALYADAAGEPGALMGASQVGTISAGAAPAWVRLALPTPRSLAAGTYHLAILSGATGRVARYSREPQSAGLRSGADRFSDGAADPYGTGAPDNYEVAIHALLAASAPPAPEPPPPPPPPPAEPPPQPPPPSGTAFGRQEPGSQWFAMGADYKRSSRFTLTEAGTVTDLVAYLDGAGGSSGSQDVQLALYADQAGEPGALLAASEVGTIVSGAAAAWVRLPLPTPRALTAGAYHLALLAGDNARVARYSRDPRADGLRSVRDTFSDGASDPYGQGSADDYELAIHALLGSAAPPPAGAPVNLTPPVVSGTPQVGQTLTTTTGTWSNAPTRYSYQWRRCDAAGGGCVAITGATSSSYTLVTADQGTTLRAAVTATNAAGSATATSLPTPVVGPATTPTSCSRYAAPSGSNSNPGTAADPYATVQYLVEHLSPGQTGCLFGGSYVGNLTMSAGSVTVASVPGERARLLGYVWIRSSANDVILRDLDIDGHDVGPPTVQVNGDRVTLRNLEITNWNKPGRAYNAMCVLAGPNFEASAANTAIDLTVAESWIHNCGDDAHEHAIYLESTRDAHVVDSHLYDNPGYGVHMYPDAQGSLIEYTLIDGNSSACKANLTFSGEAAGGEYGRPHASSNNVVQYSLITYSLCRYNVESYYPRGALTPTGNVVRHSCVWNAPWGNFGYLRTEDGAVAYTQRDNLDVNPLYTDRANKDFTLRPGSPCTGWGPRVGTR
jgi:hypothetical protein